MSDDHFEATFVLVDRPGHRVASASPSIRSSRRAMIAYWLPGFDATATVLDEDAEARLRVTKDDEPCAGTEIVVTLTDTEAGTRITVVQSRFGELAVRAYEMMAVGWRHIVADLHTYLATGAPRPSSSAPVGRSRGGRDSPRQAVRVGAVRAGTSPTVSASTSTTCSCPCGRTGVELRRSRHRAARARNGAAATPAAESVRDGRVADINRR